MTNTKRPEPKPLNIRCTNSDCEAGLHCFRKSRQMTTAQVGQCRSCGARLIDWERVRQRNLADAGFVFQSLKHEWVRHHFWHTPIDEKAELHARRKGRTALAQSVEAQLRRAVGPAQPFRDGWQTPQQGRVVYYAQHALACCCRACMEYWHGIPKGVELTPEHVTSRSVCR